MFEDFDKMIRIFQEIKLKTSGGRNQQKLTGECRKFQSNPKIFVMDLFSKTSGKQGVQK